MKRIAMKSIAVAFGSTVAFASIAQQPQSPVTRAQVRDELMRLEACGYRPLGDDYYYPEDIQAAQRCVERRQAQSGMGGTSGGTGQAGTPMAPAAPRGDDDN